MILYIQLYVNIQMENNDQDGDIQVDFYKNADAYGKQYLNKEVEGGCCNCGDDCRFKSHSNEEGVFPYTGGSLLPSIDEVIQLFFKNNFNHI